MVHILFGPYFFFLVPTTTTTHWSNGLIEFALFYIFDQNPILFVAMRGVESEKKILGTGSSMFRGRGRKFGVKKFSYSFPVFLFFWSFLVFFFCLASKRYRIVFSPFLPPLNIDDYFIMMMMEMEMMEMEMEMIIFETDIDQSFDQSESLANKFSYFFPSLC